MSSSVTGPNQSSTSPSSSPNMSGISLGLARIHRLLSSLQSPHLATPIIHISGTNGKGSVSSYLSSILSHSGLRVGRFNSPHLVDEWDCLSLAGRTIPRSLYESTKRHVEQTDRSERIGATSFEILTATAYSIFASTRPKLDLAIVEVGMGGLTDATNVVPSERTLMSIITSIELDHQKFLGETIAEIAAVKAGIIKQGTDVVLAQQAHQEVEEVVKRIAGEMKARLFLAGEATPEASTSTSAHGPTLVSIPLNPVSSYPSSTPSSPTSILANLPLPGEYQYQNCAVATLATQLLRSSPRPLSLLPSLESITTSSIQSGIESTRWPGRLDWLTIPSTSQRILVDGAHNPSSAEQLSKYLRSLPAESKPTTLVIAISAPRPPLSLLMPLLGDQTIRKIVCVGFSLPDGMPWIKPTPPEEIRRVVEENFKGVKAVDVCDDVKEALMKIGVDEKVVVAGSLYLAADVYRFARSFDEHK